MQDETFKLPRLYTKNNLIDKSVIALSTGQAHYLNNVLRRKEGDSVRLFNGKNGEWVGILQNVNKKSANVFLQREFIPQPELTKRIHLLFAPIKKNRMDWLIEKSVELGVTDLHPIITQNTEVRKIKEERITHQILEASEQCERLQIPVLHGIQSLSDILNNWPQDIEILACLERQEGQNLEPVTKDTAILIGPEGGFTVQEKEQISKTATAVTLGDQILRAETAALKALSILMG